MEKTFDGVVSMIDSLNKLAYICYKNGLLTETVDYLVDIKKALEEKEKLEQAFELACIELSDKDSTLYDLYDRLDAYYETKDRHETRRELLERAEEDEWGYQTIKEAVSCN